MAKDYNFWKYADCEDCPILSKDDVECPLDNNYFNYEYVLTCPYLNNNLDDDLKELMSSHGGYISKPESFNAKALNLDSLHEGMFVNSAKALMWLLNALKLQEENILLKDKIKRLERR